MANKFNHFKLWLYNFLGFGWSAHWSPDGKLLAVYRLPTIVRPGGIAPNKVLHADAAMPPSAEPLSGSDIVPAVESDTLPRW